LNPCQEEVGLYLHIPFCDRRCHFCPFFTQGYREESAAAFIADLLGEIRLYGKERPLRDQTITTIYFGGGTPTTLSAAQLISILDTCREAFPFTATPEITLEANPASVHLEMLRTLHEKGFNRLSLGAQSFDDAELVRLGSPHTAKDSESAVVRAREAGLANVNLDLIYALPLQTHDRFTANLNAAIALAPEHLSIYGFTLEEGTGFWREAKKGRLSLLDDETSADMYVAAIALLQAAGYRRYEISNFAKPGLACRHNLGYWSDRQWFGLGPSAHSYYDGQRFSNVESLERYHCLVALGVFPVEEHEPADPDLRLREAIAFGLRRVRGVELAAMERRYGIDPLERFKTPLTELIGDGWLSIHEGFLQASPQGLMIADDLSRAFL
jgi:oxygen-independent coproporphyrinogen III oxidase